MYDQALVRQEKSRGRSPDTLITVGRMGSVHGCQGDYRKALELYDRVLVGQERLLGRDHLSTLTTVNNMALVYVTTRKRWNCTNGHWLGGKSLLGETTPTPTIVNNMALVYGRQGDYTKALEFYDQALAGKEKSLGRDHPGTIDTVHNMASVYES